VLLGDFGKLAIAYGDAERLGAWRAQGEDQRGASDVDGGRTRRRGALSQPVIMVCARQPKAKLHRRQ